MERKIWKQYAGTVLAVGALLLSGCSDSNTEEEFAGEVRAKNWYVRPVVTLPQANLKIVASRLGQVESGAASKTLYAMKPYGSRFVDVVFVDTKGVQSGTYQTLFHTSTAEGEEDRWQFEVKVGSADVDADVALSIRGVYVLTPYVDDVTGEIRYREFLSRSNPILPLMYLKDVQTGVCLSAMKEGETLHYFFNMDGESSRTFEWMLEANITKACSIIAPMRAKVQMSGEVGEQIHFDLGKPPKAQRYR